MGRGGNFPLLYLTINLKFDGGFDKGGYADQQNIPQPMTFPASIFACSERKRHDGFTMIELLCTVAIMAILMSLAGAGWTRMISKAQEAKCQGNLRQIGMGMNLYATDNNNRFPAGWDGNQSYAKRLIPYLEQKMDQPVDNLFTCPGHKLPLKAGVNDRSLMTYSAHGRLCPDIVDGAPANWPTTVTVRRPSQTILVGDGSQVSDNLGQATATFYRPWEEFSAASSVSLNQAIPTSYDADGSWSVAGGSVRYRHSGRVNVVMVDGHVEAISKGKILYRNLSVDRE